MTLHGRVSAPSVAFDTSQFALYVQPAPFGIADLTRSSLSYLHRSSQMLFSVEGTATGRWTDLGLSSSRLWRIGERFRVGTSGNVSWQQAQGFSSIVGAAATVHVSADLNDAFTIAGGADDLFSIGTWREPPTRTLRVGLGWRGPVGLSANLLISPSERISLSLAAIGRVHPSITLRGGMDTEPFRVNADARLEFGALWPITLSTAYTHRLGFQTSFVIEVP